MADGVTIVTDFPFDSADKEYLQKSVESNAIWHFIRDAAALRLNVPHADIICSFRPPNDIAQTAQHLKWLQYPGAGADSLIEQGFELAKLPFKICTANIVNAVATAEYVLSAALLFAHKWDAILNMQAKKIWATGRELSEIRGFELQGKTMGIIGLGSVGRHVAKLARAFGMKTVGVRRTETREDDEDTICDSVFSAAYLTEVLEKCHYVVLALPLTAVTKHIINETALKAMRHDSYLINIARGSIIHEPSLIRAMRERWIAGAVLDVTETEPLPASSPLWTIPGVFISPHVSGLTTGYSHRVAEIFAQNINRFLQGMPLLYQVDPERGY